MLFWVSPAKFVAGGWELKHENSEIRLIDDRQTADKLISWIKRKQTGIRESVEGNIFYHMFYSKQFNVGIYSISVVMNVKLEMFRHSRHA